MDSGEFFVPACPQIRLPIRYTFRRSGPIEDEDDDDYEGRTANCILLTANP